MLLKHVRSQHPDLFFPVKSIEKGRKRVHAAQTLKSFGKFFLKIDLKDKAIFEAIAILTSESNKICKCETSENAYFAAVEVNSLLIDFTLIFPKVDA
jgi:hypothetical protein